MLILLVLLYFLPISCGSEIEVEEDIGSKGVFKYNKDNSFTVAYKFQGEKDYDLVQFWDYDLQGDLDLIYTFSQVIKVKNIKKTPKISVGRNDGESIMAQSSDCILATRFNRYPNYSGYLEKDNTYSSGHHALYHNGIFYKTAETKEVNIKADGRVVKPGETGKAQTINIIVSTDIYDPFPLIDSILGNEDPRYEIIIKEVIDYTINNGVIDCKVTRDYVKEAFVETYGGFASMSDGLRFALFPCGREMENPEWDGFGELIRNIGINTDECYKKDYPDFNHFVKRNSSATIFESVYLCPVGIGDHSEIPDDYSIYWVYNGLGQTWKKVYHRLTYQKNFHPGDCQIIECMYNWFVPVVNTEDYLVYDILDTRVLDIKHTYSGDMPDDLFNGYNIYKQSRNIEISRKDNNSNGVLHIDSSQSGSIFWVKSFV